LYGDLRSSVGRKWYPLERAFTGRSWASISGPSADCCWEASPVLSVAVVLVVVLSVRAPFPVGVLKMTPVPIGIAYPPTRTAVNCALAIFRLAPTSVPVVVAVDPHAMIAVRVAALVGMSKRHR
jgi:hypothetical protein